MRNTHEPRIEFVERLEGEIGREARRRNRAAEARQWTPWSRMTTRLAVLGLMLASMGIGAGTVAMAYQAQDNGRRDQLASSFAQRVELAQQRVSLAAEQLRLTERQVSVGLANNMDLLEGRFKVAEAEAQFRAAVLQLEEVRLTSREPRTEVSAPLVSGQDFVSRRLQIEMSVPQAALAFEQPRLREIQTRFQVGMTNATAVEASRVRVSELEVALGTFRAKLDIRQKFLSKGMDAVEAELRVLEGEAELRTKILVPRLELARKEMRDVATKVSIGTSQGIELAEAKLRGLQLEADLTKAELDLALVRRQIAQHRAGR